MNTLLHTGQDSHAYSKICIVGHVRTIRTKALIFICISITSYIYMNVNLCTYIYGMYIPYNCTYVYDYMYKGLCNDG